jgi:DNA-binding IclR family transcriptional regulator
VGATPAEQATLDAVAALVAAGEQPSSYAVAERLGIARQVAHRHLLALERKGLVRDRPKRVRSGHWEVTPSGERAD